MFRLPLFLLATFIVLHCVNASNGDELFARHVERALINSRQSILTSLRESGAPFVRVHDCIDDPVSELSLEKTIAKNTTLYRIFKTKELRFGSLTTQTYRLTFQRAIDDITNYFTKTFGKKVYAVNIEFGTNSELIEALLSHDIDLTFPGFYINGFYPTRDRLSDIRPLCSLTALDFYFYVRADPSEDYPKPFSDVKGLMNSTLSLDRSILCFSAEVASILKQAYPDVTTVLKSSGSDIGKLLKSAKYTAVFASLLYEKELVEQSRLKLISGDFALPALVYTRTEDKKIMLENKGDLKAYHTGNNALRNILDSILYERQAINYKVEIEMDDLDKVVTFGDCVTNPPVVPDPLDYDGLIQQIVGEREVRVGYAKMESSLIKVSDVITGPVFDLDKSVIAELSTVLGVALKFVPVVYESADALFRGLESGRIDMTSSAMITGSTFDNMPRRWLFQYTCSPFGWELKILTLTKYGMGKTFSAFKQKICSLPEGTAKFIVLNNAIGEVLNDALNCNIIIETFSKMSSAISVALKESNYYGIVPEFIDTVAQDYALDLVEVRTGEYIPTAIFLRKDASLEFEERESIFFLVSIILFGCVALAIIAIFIIYYIHVFRAKKTVFTNAFVSDHSMNEKAYIQLDVQSIGDEEDPDYVSPKF